MSRIYIIPRKSAKTDYIEALVRHKAENAISILSKMEEEYHSGLKNRNVDISRLNEVRPRAEYN